MKQPITVNVSRELGNAGDVILSLTDAAGENMKLGVPGDCTPYSAISALRPFIEGALNGTIEPDASHTENGVIRLQEAARLEPQSPEKVAAALEGQVEAEVKPVAPVDATSPHVLPSADLLAAASVTTEPEPFGPVDAYTVTEPVPHVVENDLLDTLPTTKKGSKK